MKRFFSAVAILILLQIAFPLICKSGPKITGQPPTDPVEGFTVKSGKQIILPLHNDASTPELAFMQTDGVANSGFYLGADNTLFIAIDGSSTWIFSNVYMGSDENTRPRMQNETPTATNPNFVPYASDNDTGVGRAYDDQYSAIAGGLEGIRILEANSIVYAVIGGTEVDQETDGDTDGTTTITSDGAAGDDFISTCTIGDLLFIYGGTTVADYGPYQIVTVTDDNNLVLDSAPSGTNSDVDFVIIHNYILVDNGDITIAGNFTSAASSDPMIIIKDSDATAGDNNYVLDIDATDTGDGTEDIDVTEQVQVAGNATTVRHVDADGDYETGAAAMPHKIVGQFVLNTMTETYTVSGDMTDPLTASTILLDGDNDGTAETLDLQNGETAGQIAIIIAHADIDAAGPDSVTINFGDTTCTGCAATVFDVIGENAMFIWTGATWVQISLQDSL